LPPETLLFGLVGANLPEGPLPGKMKGAADVIDWVMGLAPTHLQVGGGQTLGHGIVRVRWTGKKVSPAPARKARAEKKEHHSGGVGDGKGPGRGTGAAPPGGARDDRGVGAAAVPAEGPGDGGSRPAEAAPAARPGADPGVPSDACQLRQGPRA